MRVAALYDIHGNLPALEAVLAEVAEEGVDEVVIGGDVIPGPMPGECLDALLALDVPVRSIFGNGERDTLVLHAGEELTRVPKQFHEVMRWVEGRLTPEHLAELKSWPLRTRLEIPGVGDVLFCHATPRDDNEIFTSQTPEERLRPIFDPTRADVVVCGHTHMQFDRMIGEVRVVNAGSVGMPFGDPGAFWVMLGPDVELRRTEYDLDAAEERVAAAGYPSVAPFEIRNPPPAAQMEQVFEAAALR